MEWVIELIKAIAPGLIVAIVMAIFNRDRKKRDDKQLEREKLKEGAERVQLSLLLATAKLTYAVAMAIKRGTPNGEVEEGIEEYRRAIDQFRKFEREHFISAL